VEGATHRQVVELIKSSDQILKLTVISVAPEIAEKFESNVDSGAGSQGGSMTIDYSDKRSLPITIPGKGLSIKGVSSNFALRRCSL
jgi:hypothetical protein